MMVRSSEGCAFRTSAKLAPCPLTAGSVSLPVTTAVKRPDEVRLRDLPTFAAPEENDRMTETRRFRPAG